MEGNRRQCRCKVRPGRTAMGDGIAAAVTLLCSPPPRPPPAGAHPGQRVLVHSRGISNPPFRDRKLAPAALPCTLSLSRRTGIWDSNRPCSCCYCSWQGLHALLLLQRARLLRPQRTASFLQPLPQCSRQVGKERRQGAAIRCAAAHVRVDMLCLCLVYAVMPSSVDTLHLLYPLLSWAPWPSLWLYAQCGVLYAWMTSHDFADVCG